MNEKERSRLDQDWDRHWQRARKGGGSTWLGRCMTSAKIRVVERLIADLDMKTVLDVGCGQGHLYRAFLQEGIDVLGIDASPTAVSLCRDQGLNVRHIRLEDMQDAFDLVASDGLLEHELDFAPTAGHMMRLSRRYVLLIQPNHESFTGKSLAFLAGIVRGRSILHEYNYRLEDFIRAFERGGFTLVRSHPVFRDAFRILLFQKGEAPAERQKKRSESKRAD